MIYNVKQNEILTINGKNYTGGKSVEITDAQFMNISKHIINRQPKVVIDKKHELKESKIEAKSELKAIKEEKTKIGGKENATDK